MQILKDIKNTYKQTEVGLIPSDWEVKDLVDIGEIATGTTPPTNNRNNYGEEYFFVSPADLGKGKYILDTQKKLSQIGFNIARKYPANSILFTCIGSTIGKSGISKVELSSNQQINAVFPNDLYSTDFLFYYLNFISPKIKLGASEQAVPMINKTEFSKTTVALPSKAEQTAIATALSDADALISSLEKLIAKKRNIKQGAMQQLLQPKEGWEVKKLGDLFKLSASNSKSGYLTDEGKYIVMDMGAVSSEGTILKSKRTNLNSDILNYGDLVMPKDDIGGGNIIGKVGYIDKTDSYVLGDHVYKLELITSKIDSLYFYFLINSVYINKHFRAKASGSAQLGLGRKSVLEQELIYPCTKEEQTRIATILSDMDAEISALESKLEKYRKVKLGMMQNLLTGKIRLV